LETGGAYAIAFASGSAATATLVQAAGPNAHILSVNDVYGGTFRYLKRVASEIQGSRRHFSIWKLLTTPPFSQRSDQTPRCVICSRFALPAMHANWMRGILSLSG
jgi:O-acetylhomoserine/O-acetylserine sulfhydrylase-like pyridoxal-dependent enzyme